MFPSPPPPPPPSQPTPPSPNPSPSNRPFLDPLAIEMALATLQQRIDLLQANLTQQNKLATLGMVTAVIAHEFNNILTPMISYTTFALSEKADEPLRTKALTKALAGAQRMANISKSLLGFARGDESATANIAAAVRETLACLSRELHKDGITLTIDVAEDLAVTMNAGQLQQVLMNLVVNARSAMLARHTAIEASNGHERRAPATLPAAEDLPSSVRRAAVIATRRGPSGGAPTSRGGGVKRLAIRAAASPDGKRVTISVADTGPGIAPEVLPRIFDPFFSTKRRGATPEPANAENGADEGVPRGGTGLGLTICHELVAAAGGTIRAESEWGKGATFTIELVRGCTAPRGEPGKCTEKMGES